MKVYKKDVYEFLDKVEAKAINSVEKKYNDLILQSKQERTKEYIQDVHNFISKVEAISEEAKVLYEKHKGFYNRPEWSYLKDMNNHLESSLRCGNYIFPSGIDMNGAEQQLNIEKKQQLDEVKKEYAKLKHYAKNNSAKEAYNLLKEIGFDVSSLEQKENVIIAKADKSKLFVCGENK